MMRLSRGKSKDKKARMMFQPWLAITSIPIVVAFVHGGAGALRLRGLPSWAKRAP
jgi:hypothetical protein